MLIISKPYFFHSFRNLSQDTRLPRMRYINENNLFYFMKSEKSISVFQDKNIRTCWHNNEWYFAVIDIVKALIDTVNSSDYLKKMRKRDSYLNKGWGQIVTPLKISTSGGIQIINCTNAEGAFRLIQSIPSKKAEPFKLWLAKVGYERVKEIEDPELAKQRMVETYRLKGYSEEWIKKRLRGIAVRDELTNEWTNRDVKEGKEFAILTNEISKATFGKTITEYKAHKNLNSENLRDHMDDLELIFTMLGEASTTHIAKAKDSQGFDENKTVAKEGGEVAGSARTNLELKSGTPVTTNKNYLTTPEKIKRLAHKKRLLH